MCALYLKVIFFALFTGRTPPPPRSGKFFAPRLPSFAANQKFFVPLCWLPRHLPHPNHITNESSLFMSKQFGENEESF